MGRFHGLLLALAVTLAPGIGSAAPGFPQRPVTLVVPYSPGGGVDGVARLMGNELSDKWGQPVIVENRPGANGAIGTSHVARAAPDGHTILLVTPSHVVNPLLMASLPYNTRKDFAAITTLTKTPLLLVVSSKAPWNSIEQLIQDAKARPAQLSIGSSEGGSMMTGELLKQRAEVDLIPVPFKGSAAMLTSLIGNHISMGFLPVTSALPLIRDGNVKPLAVASPQRVEVISEVPTFNESGIPLESLSWLGLFAPAATPPALIEKIQADIAGIMASEDTAQKLTLGIAEIGGEDHGRFQEFIESELSLWASIADGSGIKPQ